MQTSDDNKSSVTNVFYSQLFQEIDASLDPQFQCFPKSEPYCTLESSSANGSCTTMYNSPNSPDFMFKLRQLETAMLGDADFDDDAGNEKSLSGSGSGVVDLPDIEIWKEIMVEYPRRDLKQVLIACAKSVSNDDLLNAHMLISELRKMVSVSGEPIQRLGAYMLEGLVARLSSSGSTIYKSSNISLNTHVLHEICPYFKFGYMSANGAIAEAMKCEKRVHILDFHIGHGSQWVPLIQAFARRPGGPPHIRITGLHDSSNGLRTVGKRLTKLAKTYIVPFEFHTEIGLESVQVRHGESLAVNFAFVLHRMPDESVSVRNDRDRVLRLVKSMSPKVVTLVEQESNTNTAPFYSRFLEALDYYNAMFESIDITLPREHKERINVEQHCLARDVVNIIACEGNERVERNELLGKWKLRFSMAGFSPCPMSPLVNATIKRLLMKYSERYRLEEKDGALYLGWMNRDLVASCAWK
ncbi:scarecrow-like protein 21 [Rutidosis leptorrhynchoides]|uniref:scarecrow-like protein 21 n=1 Tax=Rutidosis leptorrhynchoides TaxID=125765 RepID=UPI003A9908EB